MPAKTAKRGKKPTKRAGKKAVRRKPKKVRYKRACPNCGSQNFGTVGTDLTFLTGSAAHTYRCYSCGYQSRVFPLMSPRELSQFKVGARKGKPVPRPPAPKPARKTVKGSQGKKGSRGKKAAAAAAGIGLLYFLGIGGFIIVVGSCLTYKAWKRKRK